MPASQSKSLFSLAVLAVLTLNALLPTALACEPVFKQGAQVAISNGYGGSWTMHGTVVGTSVFVANPASKEDIAQSSGKFEVVRKKGGKEGDGVYTIGLANKTKMAVSNAKGHTHIDKANQSDSLQQYHIECQSCTSHGAQACKITLKKTGECLTGSNPGDFVAPAACNPRYAGQFWKLVAH